MRAQATICLDLPSKGQLEVVLEALRPEITVASAQRSRVHVESEGKTLTLKFNADDTSALRAATNSFLRWVLLARTIVEAVDRSPST